MRFQKEHPTSGKQCQLLAQLVGGAETECAGAGALEEARQGGPAAFLARASGSCLLAAGLLDFQTISSYPTTHHPPTTSTIINHAGAQMKDGV